MAGTDKQSDKGKSGKDTSGKSKGRADSASSTPVPASASVPASTNGLAAGGTAGEGRRVRVRSRLVAGVAVLGITVVAAGAPAVLTASAELNDAQRLVTLAELNQQAVVLAHSLADERDEVVVFIAAGRETQPDGTGSADGTGSSSGDTAGSNGSTDSGSGDTGTGSSSGGGDKGKHTISDTRSARVDRQIDEIRTAASASPGLLHDLSTVPSIRRTALTGKGSALEAYRA
ncbi:hypothetical protein GT002_33020, partial [Streptomyces sp. SID4917]